MKAGIAGTSRLLPVIIACLWVGARAERAEAMIVEWRPISATGAHSVVGNDIILTGGGQIVTLEFYLSDWDPDLNGAPTMGAYQITLDSTGYTSGSGAALTPLTVPNLAAGCFIVVKRCTVNQQIDPAGVDCTSGPCPGGEFCVDNPDYVFAGTSPIAATATVNPDYEYGASVGPGAQSGTVDMGIARYGGTLRVNVPANAQGTYTLNFVNDPNRLFVIDFGANPITPLDRVPARIIIACATNADCNDGNACTNDVCNPDSTCSNVNNYNPATHCCNPANGAQVVLSDNNSCTDDVCDEMTGQVTHPNHPAGMACGNPGSTECDQPDTCNGSGVCLPNPRPSGFPCGDPTNTECDGADTCSGMGVCNNNRLPAGSPCGNMNDSDCTDPDTCNGLGTCLPNNVPNGIPCNDGLFCNQGEFCSGGSCIGGNPVDCNDGLSCTTDVCNDLTDQCDNTLNAMSCLISGVCYAEGELDPMNTCFACDTASSDSSFTQLPDGTACDDGNPCTGTGAPGVGLDTCDVNGVCSGLPDPECNDTCVTAVEVFAGTNSGFNNSAASAIDDVEVSCQPDSNNDIWFFYVASCSGPVVVSTTGSLMAPSNDSVLSVHDDCGGNELACDDDSGLGLHASLIFNATLNTTYYIRVAGFEDNEGSVTVNIATVDGCLIDGVCYAEDDLNPDNDCEACLPDVSTSGWSPRSEGSACGDPTDTQCDSPDACDGAGLCEINLKPDNTPCDDEGLECTFDYCVAGLCAHPPVAPGVACGSASDTECDNPDSCDGMGGCAPNFESNGFPCGDPFDDQCNNADICDGSGMCVVNFEPDGTACNDADICTELDQCTSGLCAGSAIPDAPTALQHGPRTVTVAANPPGSVAPVALRITSPDWPCLDLYVQANGTINNTPVVQLPDDWGTVVVKGIKIIPGSQYDFVAECGSFTSPLGSASTCLWADVNCDGVANFMDVQLIILGFQGNFSPGIPFESLDIEPCTPQGVINFIDVQRAILAFQGQTYAGTGCPLPCP